MHVTEFEKTVNICTIVFCNKPHLINPSKTILIFKYEGMRNLILKGRQQSPVKQ